MLVDYTFVEKLGHNSRINDWLYSQYIDYVDAV
jgi:hypothetical protein